MLNLPISLIAVHWLADWRLQTNWMALNKSKNNLALLAHVATYSACLVPWGLKFAGANFVLHFITDYFTSRYTSKWFFFKWSCGHCGEPVTGGRNYCDDCGKFAGEWRYDDKARGKFFNMIGLDQLIHYVTLAVTYRFLVS